MLMQGWQLGRGCWMAAAGLIALAVGVRAGTAQQNSAANSDSQSKATAQKTGTPTLGEILQRLQENVDQYQAEVPSFFCDEHVVSTIIPDPRNESRVTDATFRLKRVPEPGVKGATILEESHEVKMVNGRPATGDSVGGPAYLRGAFSNGLALVSASQQACMRTTLRPIRKNNASDPITIQFASVPASRRPHDCRIEEDVSGRVLIDPETMQVRHLEFTVPRHYIGTTTYTTFNGLGLDEATIVGRWDVTVEYAPVVLEGQSFWLPTKITDKMSSSLVRSRWSYDATYSNYHKMEVTSRIVPSSDAPGK
jgi:hypothetical protein